MTKTRSAQRRAKKRQRRERRAKKQMSRDSRPSEWTKFEAVVRLPESGDDPGGTLYRNSRYAVAVRKREDCIHLTIVNRDHSTHHDWRDFQRIKNELVGPEAEAVELYPSESRLIDTTNSYHLWVLEKDRFPYGFDKGRQVESEVESGLPQRPPSITPEFVAGDFVWVLHSILPSEDGDIGISLPACVEKITPREAVCIDDAGNRFTVPATCVFASYEELEDSVAGTLAGEPVLN